MRVARRNRFTSRGLFLGGLLLVGGVTTAAGAEWAVPQAPLRFTFSLYMTPPHSASGYVAQVPDGGLLPKGPLQTTVIADDGTLLESYRLWHGVSAGLWIVFAKPGQRVNKVDVYVVPAKQPRTWTPQTGLRPGPLLVTEPGAASLANAEKLAGLGLVGSRVQIRPKAGIRQAPLSVGGDDSGRPRPTSFYLQAYVETSDPGRTWIAPFFNEGQNRVLIDGVPLNPSKRNDKWGGTGAWVNLAKGLHRVEIFSASQPSGAYTHGNFRGHAYLAWKTPTMPDSELGGTRASDQPQPGTSTWAARVIKDHEIARSGYAELAAVAARDGNPVAVARLEAEQLFWFEGEEALAIYEFKAVTKGNPADTSYTWSFEDGTRVSGETIRWLLPSLREQRVRLTAVSGRKKSSFTLPFFTFAITETSVDRRADRRAFREALATMLKVYPLDPDPCAEWSRSYWNNLVRTADYGAGYELLANLLGQRLPVAAKNLSARDLSLLQDILLDAAPQEDPARAVKLARRFFEFTTDTGRKAALRIREAQIRMIYLDQAEAAGKILATEIQLGGETAERARIRIGDLYLQQGDLNKATELYADVQQRVRHQRQTTPAPGRGGPDDWKLGAVKDAAYSEQVAALVAEANYLEARQLLDRWERAFPLSKISEDFIVREAELYMDLGDWNRARWLLEPYCRQVDASSYLPEAAEALLRCMEKLNEPREKMEETVVFLKKRLEFHPVAERLQFYIPERR